MRTRFCKVVMNPNPALKPVATITDRAKRYRANKKENRPLAPKWCGFCGSRRNVGIHHVNGSESDGKPHNLMWACKACNGKVGAILRKAGIGQLTRQLNPRRARGSRRDQMKSYGAAIKVMRGVFPGDVGRAVATIRATPPDVRSDYTAQTWGPRRELYGPSGRQTSLPF